MVALGYDAVLRMMNEAITILCKTHSEHLSVYMTKNTDESAATHLEHRVCRE